jgi:CelD/BcsL family acetyltransferase involved in cellulose biosynthesis
VLSLDGRGIAISLNLQAGRTCCAIKCAYDETYRRFSPGLVLELLVIEHLFASRFADELDSCVTQAGHVIQDLWDGAVEVGTLALRPRGSRIGIGPIGLDLAHAELRRAELRQEAKAHYLAAREAIASLWAMMTGEAEAKAAKTRERLDASSRRAMMTINAAQPNGEFAAVLTAMI